MTADDRLHSLNIGLMLASCVAAFVLPFELFLFAYAVLGPLHYLTEISWIHDRRYFLDADKSRTGRQLTRLWLALVGLVIAVMSYGVVAEKLLDWPTSPAWEIGLFYLAFVAAALAVFRVNELLSAVVIVFVGLGLVASSTAPWYGLIAFLILTIIHVLVFTGAFVLFGALKTRSRLGLASLLVFLACAMSFFVYVPLGVAPGGYVRESYALFETLNAQLIRAFGLGAASTLSEVYELPGGIAVMRLIAFAYSYHYLNWFTKTSVIRWHQVSRPRAGLILLLWLGALALYAYSYLLGFVLLYTLSALHVLLELPLNHQSFAGIARELRMRFRPAPAAPATAPAKARKRR